MAVRPGASETSQEAAAGMYRHMGVDRSVASVGLAVSFSVFFFNSGTLRHLEL